MYFSCVAIIYPWKNVWSFILEKKRILFTNADTLGQVWLRLTQYFLRKSYLKIVNIFSACRYYMYLHLEKGVVLPLNLISLYPWEFYAEFGWNWVTLTAFQQLEGCVLIEPHLLRRVSSCLRMLYTGDRTSSRDDGKQGVLKNSSKLKHHRISAANHSFAFVCGSPTIPTLYMILLIPAWTPLNGKQSPRFQRPSACVEPSWVSGTFSY